MYQFIFSKEKIHMQLQLATVLSNIETGCLVKLLESGKPIEAHYTEPMIAYRILAHPGDLVAITPQPESFHIVFRWKRVYVEKIEGDRLQVHDTVGQIYSIDVSQDFVGLVREGDEVFTDNTAVSDLIINDQPANTERLRQHYFPQIRAMYAQIDAAHEQDPKEIVTQGYDQIAEEYLAWSLQVRVEERERYTAWILSQLPPDAKVLDLGCGTGLTTTKALAARFRVTGVDISEKHIEIARAKLPQATFIQADMTELTFAPDSFDGIVAFYSLFHLPREEQKILLPQITSWLRPGGFFVATLGIHAMSASIEEDWLGATMYWSSYDGATNRHLIQEVGLQIVQANEETAEEMGQPITFLWVIAQKPTGASSESGNLMMFKTA
jgi:ubiquinone/menaquinone biosynthesis C-methylase UbiE